VCATKWPPKEYIWSTKRSKPGFYSFTADRLRKYVFWVALVGIFYRLGFTDPENLRSKSTKLIEHLFKKVAVNLK
jgi:hypothetical protein